MKKMTFACVVMASSSAFAALPPAPAVCRFPRKITQAHEVTSVPADQVQWNCLNVSGLPKSDLMAIAGVAPALSIRLSESSLNKSDLIEAQQRTKITAVVNTRRFNLLDIQDLQRAGVNVLIQTFGLSLTVLDYQAIAGTGGFTLEVNSKTLTKQQVLDFAKMDGVRVIIDPIASGLSGADIQEIMAAVPSVNTRPE